MTQVTSKQFTVNWLDIGKGLLLAILTPAVATIEQSLEAGKITFNWKLIAITSASAGLAYLVKNFFQPAKTIITPPPTTSTNNPNAN